MVRCMDHISKKGKSTSLYKSLIIDIAIQTPIETIYRVIVIAQCSNVCIIIYCLFMPDHIVAFPEKLLKTIATRCAIFNLKFTKNRLADPLGELKRSPRRSLDPLAAIWRPTSEGRGR